jgi:hypothetical protein
VSEIVDGGSARAAHTGQLRTTWCRVVCKRRKQSKKQGAGEVMCSAAAGVCDGLRMERAGEQRWRDPARSRRLAAVADAVTCRALPRPRRGPWTAAAWNRSETAPAGHSRPRQHMHTWPDSCAGRARTREKPGLDLLDGSCRRRLESQIQQEGLQDVGGA